MSAVNFSLAVGVDPGKIHMGIAVVKAENGREKKESRSLQLIWSAGFAVDGKIKNHSLRVRHIQQKFMWWRKYAADRSVEIAFKNRTAFVVEKPLIFLRTAYITNDVSLTAGIALGVFSDSFFVPFLVPYSTWRKAFSKNADLTRVYYQLFEKMPLDDHERDAALLAYSFLIQELWQSNEKTAR